MLVVEEKFIERSWWKYGLALAALQMALWILLGYKLNPHLNLGVVFTTGYVVYGTFILAAFLPFIAGRLQMKRLAWFGLAAFVIADSAYFVLALIEATRRLTLLPYAAFVQLYIALFGIGIVVEFGRYVFLKLTDRT